jgi:hypothetical protein
VTHTQSIAGAMKEAHTALFEALDKLEAAIHPGSTGGLTELYARLGTTLAHITEHFQFEEQNGYMDAVRKREPRLDREIRHLRAEHAELAHSLNDIIRAADAVTNVSESLEAQVRVWVERVRQHERHENGLVQNAFNLDVGAED